MAGQPSGEKTEQPTPKKERDSRQKGQVAKSQEVTTTLSLMSVIAVLWFFWDTFFERLIYMFDEIPNFISEDFSRDSVKALDFVFDLSVIILMPVLLVTIVSGIVGNVVQFGFLFTGESAKPKGEHISIISGFKRIFSVKQLVETLKSILKIIFMSALLWLVFQESISAYIQAIHCGLNCMANIFSSLMIQIMLYAAMAFVVVSIFDFMFQRHTHTKSLMMTKDEVKREYKDSEGDPLLKGERKRVAQEITMSDASPDETKNASALVVNPTHFAIAIQYSSEEEALPKLIDKGLNFKAARMREIAENSGIPVFHNPLLARTLYAEVPLFTPIPDEFLSSIAKILHWIEIHKDELYDKPLKKGFIDEREL